VASSVHSLQMTREPDQIRESAKGYREIMDHRPGGINGNFSNLRRPPAGQDYLRGNWQQAGTASTNDRTVRQRRVLEPWQPRTELLSVDFERSRLILVVGGQPGCGTVIKISTTALLG
jgi:hypothetical protein